MRIHNLFATYLNLNCFFIPVNDRSHWMPLFYSQSKRNPTHFEDFFGKIKERWCFNETCFTRLEKEKKTLIGKHRGFNEMFTPVVSGGICRGFLAAGSFLRAPFSEIELSRLWADLTSRNARVQDSDFLSFARMALDTVVLAPPALEGCKELMEILAEYMCGRADENIAERLEELRISGISHCLPHFIWMDFMLGMDKFFPKVNAGEVIHEWETQELGITHYPTTVFAVTHHAPARENWSALKSMVSANRLQWEALGVAREFPETVAGKLEDYGALFVTSAAPSKSGVQAKLEIRDRVEAIRRRLEKRTGLKVMVGVGSTLAPGDKLVESRHQAVLAMNLCASLERSVIFYEDISEKTQHSEEMGLRQALARLRKTYLGGASQEREAARIEYVRQALIYSNERIESLRLCLLEAFFFLADSLCGRFISVEAVDVIADSMEKRFLTASSIQEILSLFREGLEKICQVGDRPSEGGRLARMEHVKRYVDLHFTQPLRLGDVAVKAGLSKEGFLKNFKSATGQGFSPYLQRLRLEEAKRLLRVSTLSIARVGQESGFNSASYFIQAFKRSAGVSPRIYRGKERKKPSVKYK